MVTFSGTHHWFVSKADAERLLFFMLLFQYLSTQAAACEYISTVDCIFHYSGQDEKQNKLRNGRSEQYEPQTAPGNSRISSYIFCSFSNLVSPPHMIPGAHSDSHSPQLTSSWKSAACAKLLHFQGYGHWAVGMPGLCSQLPLSCFCSSIGRCVWTVDGLHMARF